MLQTNCISRTLYYIKIFIIILATGMYFHYFHHQSWGYFTIDPKQPLINIYVVNKGSLSNESLIKNNMSYGMGVSRKGLILYDKLAKVVLGNKSLVWRKYRRDLPFLLKNYQNIIKINYNDLSVGKGLFVLTKTERTLFENRYTKENYNTAIYYTLINVQ